jgi:DNA-binding winged helix-turn-helix (wHTH) protein
MLDLVRFEAKVVQETVRAPRLVRFGAFELDPRAGELRKDGAKLKLTGQPFQVLTILLEQPGQVVTREELQKRLWPDTFVDADHNLNTAINKIREVLGDSAESPSFVETLPRRGYRFVAPVEGTQTAEVPSGSGVRQESRMPWVRRPSILFVVLVLLAAVGFFIYRRLQSPASRAQRTLTRLTFDDGLQIGATWSADGRFIAYSSNRGASSTFGCNRLVVATRCRSQRDQVTTGSRTGHLMASSLRIAPKTATAACFSYLRLAAKAWKGESHLSDITLAGPPTARRSCSKQHHLPWRIGST